MIRPKATDTPRTESRELISDIVSELQGKGAREAFVEAYSPENYPVVTGPFDNIVEVRDAIDRQGEGLEVPRAVRIMGRVATIRLHKGYAFVMIQDQALSDQPTQLQAIVARRVDDGDGNYTDLEMNNQALSRMQLGSFVVVEGLSSRSRTGEPSVLVQDVPPIVTAQSFISPETLNMPDSMSRQEMQKMFEIRTKVRSSIRRSLEDDGYTEVITPVLSNVPSGANAEVFDTYTAALDKDASLRISPELALKTAIINGYGQKVYEIATDFRNEGIDREHSPEFEMVEFYSAFTSWDQLRNDTEEMVRAATLSARGTTEITLEKEDGTEIEVDLADWKKVSYRDLFLEGTGIDLDEVLSLPTNELKELLLDMMRVKFGEEFAHEHVSSSTATLIDKAFKRACRPYINQPTFVERYPAIMVPLARPNDEDPRYVDMFQGIVGSMEVIKGYQELNDPVVQLHNLMEQTKARNEGDDEAMVVDWMYIKAMLKGLPPTAGCGIGIDRLTAIVSGTKNIHNTLAYPFKERFLSR